MVVDDVRVRGTGHSGLRLQDAPKVQTGPPRVDKVGGCAVAWPVMPVGHRDRASPGRVLTPCPPQITQCYFEGGYQETPVYLLGELGFGHKLQGPCLIIDSNRWAPAWQGGGGTLVGSLAQGCWKEGLGSGSDWSFQQLLTLPSTILVEPSCQAEVTETGDIRISVGAEASCAVGAQLDPIHLSIFSHRFMSIAG